MLAPEDRAGPAVRPFPGTIHPAPYRARFGAAGRHAGSRPIPSAPDLPVR
ncbi:MAG: hypothetical protein MZU91_00710 [Desulfosudis oleivorans]|nr:hypothetical protein [Desulfosudis oleivorans]